jgi:hypothetical protein
MSYKTSGEEVTMLYSACCIFLSVVRTINFMTTRIWYKISMIHFIGGVGNARVGAIYNVHHISPASERKT